MQNLYLEIDFSYFLTQYFSFEIRLRESEEVRVVYVYLANKYRFIKFSFYFLSNFSAIAHFFITITVTKMNTYIRVFG